MHCTANLKTIKQSRAPQTQQSDKELDRFFCKQAKMATARGIAAMAMFFLVALSASHTASSLRPGAGLGTCRASGYLPGRSGNCEKSNDPDCCEDGKMYPQYRAARRRSRRAPGPC